MRRWPLIATFLLPFFFTSHAMAANNWFEDKMSCLVTGAVAGAALGAAVDGITVGGGTVGGAIIGALLCQPADSDGDGVPDRRDNCADTPKGVQVDEHGCPLDSDGDGVPDYKDTCPDTPKGVKVDENGCEIKPVVEDKPAVQTEVKPAPQLDADSDGDGVPDIKDTCPDTPQGTKVDHNGCPLVAKLELKGVWFDFDSAKITVETARVLDEVALIFKRYPTLVAEMGGHTCSIGAGKYNQRLSERRARAVRNYLISQGVNPKQLSARGYGELQPATSNATREGREKNRRTEMRVLEQ